MCTPSRRSPEHSRHISVPYVTDAHDGFLAEQSKQMRRSASPSSCGRSRRGRTWGPRRRVWYRGHNWVRALCCFSAQHTFFCAARASDARRRHESKVRRRANARRVEDLCLADSSSSQVMEGNAAPMTAAEAHAAAAAEGLSLVTAENSTGFKGVSHSGRGKPFMANLKHDGRHIYLGLRERHGGRGQGPARTGPLDWEWGEWEGRVRRGIDYIRVRKKDASAGPRAGIELLFTAGPGGHVRAFTAR